MIDSICSTNHPNLTRSKVGNPEKAVLTGSLKGRSFQPKRSYYNNFISPEKVIKISNCDLL